MKRLIIIFICLLALYFVFSISETNFSLTLKEALKKEYGDELNILYENEVNKVIIFSDRNNNGGEDLNIIAFDILDERYDIITDNATSMGYSKGTKFLYDYNYVHPLSRQRYLYGFVSNTSVKKIEFEAFFNNRKKEFYEVDVQENGIFIEKVPNYFKDLEEIEVKFYDNQNVLINNHQ